MTDYIYIQRERDERERDYRQINVIKSSAQNNLQKSINLGCLAEVISQKEFLKVSLGYNSMSPCMRLPSLGIFHLLCLLQDTMSLLIGCLTVLFLPVRVKVAAHPWTKNIRENFSQTCLCRKEGGCFQRQLSVSSNNT